MLFRFQKYYFLHTHDVIILINVQDVLKVTVAASQIRGILLMFAEWITVEKQVVEYIKFIVNIFQLQATNFITIFV